MSEPIKLLTKEEISKLRSRVGRGNDFDECAMDLNATERLLSEVERSRALLRKAQFAHAGCPICGRMVIQRVRGVRPTEDDEVIGHRHGCELDALANGAG